MNNDFILDTIKKMLGLSPSYDAFDQDIIMHINGVFSTLNQLGVGPPEGYSIEGANESWDKFLGNDAGLNLVRSYMYLKVRLLFDPPTTSFAITALKEQAQEMEWRLNVYVESTPYVPQEMVF